MLHFSMILALLSTLFLSACGDSGSGDANELDIDRSGFTANLDLAESILPFPNNLLLAGSIDGTVNIPVADPTDFSDPQVAINALDGFSTVAPIVTTFSGAIDPASLTAEAVRLFKVTLTGTGGAVTGIERELVFGTEFLATVSSVDPSGSTLVIQPLLPLEPSSSYMIALTDSIRGAGGLPPQSSANYLIAKTPDPIPPGSPAAALEGLRQLVNAQEGAMAAFGVDTATVVLSWTFSTQSVGVVLDKVRDNASGSSLIAPFSIGTTVDFLGAGPGLADVFAGTLDAPYYLTNADADPTDPLSKFWTGPGGANLTALDPDGVLIPGGTATPVSTGTETLPLLVTVPNALPKPAGGWPVVIFQHAISGDRTNLLAIADSLASAGFAAVAIDLPLHGLPSTSPLYSGIERTFDLDLVNNLTGAAGPDGEADTSGTHFINLASLLTSRDNFRQGSADLFALVEALGSMDFDGGGADFDTDNIYFVGHSLGAIAGASFLALEDRVKAAVLAMPGGAIAKLLDGSATFGPRIEAGLAANGVIKGTPEYEAFLGAAQTLVDSGDPINYGAQTASGRAILMLEVIGDLVVPNNVFADAPEGTVPSPLAGTYPLAALMGLTQVSRTTAPAVDLEALVRFISGDHRSILDPTADGAATAEMQAETVTFLAAERDTGAAIVVISDSSVVEDLPLAALK